MKVIKPIFLLITITSLYSFEVNTHQAITRCAVIVNSSNCQTEGSRNLHTFVENATINTGVIYDEEVFQSYYNNGKEETYKKYAKDGTGFKPYDINITSNYTGLIEAGSVLEDAVYHNAKLALPTGAADGRFNNHFYAAQAEAKPTCNSTLLSSLHFADKYEMQTPRALCMGYKTRTDNITWALKNGVDLGESRVNDYGIHDAFDYFADSFSGSPDDMRKNQAKLLYTGGYRC